jgi:hypothetical protein
MMHPTSPKLLSDIARTCAFISELISCGVRLVSDGYRAKNEELGGDGLNFSWAGMYAPASSREGEPFGAKMRRLMAQWLEQTSQAQTLDAALARNLTQLDERRQAAAA